LSVTIWESLSQTALYSMATKISIEEIDAVLNQPNLLIRNLQITLGYHKVSRMLRGFASTKNVNWFGFGAFASKTAGQAIRHELLPAPLKSATIRAAGYDNTAVYFHDVLEPATHSILAAQRTDGILAEILSRVSLLLSQGNLMIFEEVAKPFAALVDTFHHDWEPDDDKFQAFLESHFRPGSLEDGGQEWLMEACSCYYQARFSKDVKQKAELILTGNLLLGYHEQSRLQPVIAKSIALPFDLLTEGMIPEHDRPSHSVRGKMTQRAVGLSRQMVLHTITRMWMAYALPTRSLRVGKDLVAPTGLLNFPHELLVLEHPRCRDLIFKFEGAGDTLSGSAAGNWGSLMDRMHFLATFFRSYQYYEPLYEPPFLESQIAKIEAGQFPGGSL
jgi:hypothetical protein